MAACRNRPVILAAAGLLSAVGLSVPAATAAPPPPPPSTAHVVQLAAGTLTGGIDVALRKTPTGSVSGRAVESGSRGPLAGLQVLAYSTRQVVRRTVTDAQGRYVMQLPVSARGYVICFRDTMKIHQAHGGTSTTGWVPECSGNQVWSGRNAFVPPTAARVPVRAGQVTSHLDAALRPGGAISGRVVQYGRDRGVRSGVYVRSLGAPFYRDSVGTDGFGRYRIAGLPPARRGYLVCFDPSEETSAHGFLARCHGTRHWFGFPKQTADSSVTFTRPHWPSAPPPPCTCVRAGPAPASARGCGSAARSQAR